jgi:HEAT repeat protein
VLPGLLDALDDKHADVRRQAVRALIDLQIADKMVVVAFAAALRDPDLAVRHDAAAGLLYQGDNARPAVKALLAALRDPHARVRQRVVLALNAIDGEGKVVLPAVAELLRDRDPALRATAVEVLGQYGEDAVPLLLTALRDGNARVRKGALATLESVEGDIGAALAYVLPYVNHDDIGTRARAARLLGRMGAPAVAALTEALRDDEVSVCQAAAQSLGGIGTAAAQARPALLELIRQEALGLREHNPTLTLAVQAAVQVAPDRPAAVYELVNGVHDDSNRYQCYAILNAESVPSRETLPHLLRGLKDRNPAVRGLAVQALGEFGPHLGRGAVPALQAALNDRVPEIRDLAREALKRLQGK